MKKASIFTVGLVALSGLFTQGAYADDCDQSEPVKPGAEDTVRRPGLVPYVQSLGSDPALNKQQKDLKGSTKEFNQKWLQELFKSPSKLSDVGSCISPRDDSNPDCMPHNHDTEEVKKPEKPQQPPQCAKGFSAV